MYLTSSLIGTAMAAALLATTPPGPSQARADTHFPAPSGAITIAATTADGGPSMADVLRDFARVAGQNLSISTGASVSLDGDRLIVGEDSANSSGVAHVYERSGSTWSVAQVLQPDPPYFGTTTSGQYFGWSVDLQSGLAVVGAPGEINCNGRKGKTYVFKNGPSGWQRSDVLTGSDLAHFYTTSYGSSVTTDGKTIMVGAAEAAANRLGAVYVYPVQ
jgi:hypothetical protein